MVFDSEIAAIRFGAGLRPGGVLPRDAEQMLDRLTGPDVMARRFPIGNFDAHMGDVRFVLEARRRGRKGATEADREAARKDANARIRQLRARKARWFAHRIARWAAAEFGLRERLTAFWADHFTVVGKNAFMRALAATFVEDALRPHLAGRFADMLKAASTHPMMLHYLDQYASVGEGSIAAQRQGKGLNENLAREIMELHTLGVGGAYTQTDVRQFAKLLAGFTFTPKAGSRYAPRRGSPGAETILGKRYGGDIPRLEDVFEVLEDLAVHPDTALHLARKLVTHFVTDTPDAGHVAHVAQAYLDGGGALMPAYAALMDHPAAWDPVPHKVKQPFDFVASSVRALGVAPGRLAGLPPGKVLREFIWPMQMMGQKWEFAPGPDGWPEAAEFWVTPQGLAARIQWAMTAPRPLAGDLPDPRDFVRAALGSRAPEDAVLAAAAAQTRWEGVGLILASPEFQKR